MIGGPASRRRSRFSSRCCQRQPDMETSVYDPPLTAEPQRGFLPVRWHSWLSAAP